MIIESITLILFRGFISLLVGILFGMIAGCLIVICMVAAKELLKDDIYYKYKKCTYDCPRCGTVQVIRPFASRKSVCCKCEWNYLRW